MNSKYQCLFRSYTEEDFKSFYAIEWPKAMGLLNKEHPCSPDGLYKAFLKGKDAQKKKKPGAFRELTERMAESISIFHYIVFYLSDCGRDVRIVQTFPFFLNVWNP